MGASTSWNAQGLYRDSFTFCFYKLYLPFCHVQFLYILQRLQHERCFVLGPIYIYIYHISLYFLSVCFNKAATSSDTKYFNTTDSIITY
jgi:hypothetical protein